MKHFRINNIHTILGFVNWKRFLRKNTSLSGIVSLQQSLPGDVRSTRWIAIWNMKILHWQDIQPHLVWWTLAFMVTLLLAIDDNSNCGPQILEYWNSNIETYNLKIGIDLRRYWYQYSNKGSLILVSRWWIAWGQPAVTITLS